jgi:hypothetical protein
MPTFSVPQSGGAVSISSTAGGFTQNSDPYQYYLNSGGSSLQADKYTFTFADGASFYLTDFSQMGNGPVGSHQSSSARNVTGIPSTANTGYGSTINVIGGSNSFATYDIYDASTNTRLADNFQPQIPFAASAFAQPIGLFEYSSGTLTVRTPVQNSGFPTTASIGSAGTPNYGSPVADYRGGAGSATPLSFALTVPSSSSVVCFYQGTQIALDCERTVSVDELRIGDLVRTHKGSLPIKWVAKRTIHRNFISQDKYEESLPVRIEAGSLGMGVPYMDLLVSGPHGIHVDGKIVAASCLVNGLNIYKEKLSLYPDALQYFHLEFEDEVLVVANGVAACSYANEDNRRSFDNYPEFISLYTSADVSVKSYISKSPRNQPSLQGHKMRVKRSWQAA